MENRNFETLPINPAQAICEDNLPIVVAFSGGKDSIAMVLYLLEMGVDKKRIHLHHHDVDGGGLKLWDWECTKAYCWAFAKAFGLKMHVSYREGGITREIYRNNEGRQPVYYQPYSGVNYMNVIPSRAGSSTRGKFPAVSADLRTRWCSSTVKIDVLSTVITHMPVYNNGVWVLTGERRQESAGRSKYQEIEWYRAKSKKRWAVQWRPVIDWTEQQVWDIMKLYNVQPHPAYMLGWSRCSCQTCIFGSANIWASVNAISPNKINELAAIEKVTKFTLYNGMTLREKIAQGIPFENMSSYWIDQATKKFTAPIIVSDWVLPDGAFKTESAGAA